MPNILKVLLLVLLVGAVRWVVSRLRKSVAGSPHQARAPRRSTLGKMVRDPHCGTYVAPELAVSATRSGETLFFCSQSCRDQYLKLEARKAAAS